MKPKKRRSKDEEIVLNENNITWHSVFGYVFKNSITEDSCQMCTYTDVIQVLSEF
jgi:hypothetical protein